MVDGKNFDEDAIKLVNGERQDVYGSPYDNLSDIGKIWAVILGITPIDPEKVALCMMGTKIARLKMNYHDDGVIDFKGYENCLKSIVEYKKKLNE